MNAQPVTWYEVPASGGTPVPASDPRDACPLVQRCIKDKVWTPYEERRNCESYFIGICRKGGRRRISCAFEDTRYDLRGKALAKQNGNGKR